MSLKDWVSAARGFVGLIHEVRRLADAVERVADHLEGKRHAEGLGPDLELISTDELEQAREWDARQRFEGGGGS